MNLIFYLRKLGFAYIMSEYVNTQTYFDYNIINNL